MNMRIPKPTPRGRPRGPVLPDVLTRCLLLRSGRLNHAPGLGSRRDVRARTQGRARRAVPPMSALDVPRSGFETRDAVSAGAAVRGEVPDAGVHSRSLQAAAEEMGLR